MCILNRAILTGILGWALASAIPASAQEPAEDPLAITPEIQAAIDRVPALKLLQDRGAAVIPLGRAYGLDGWIAQMEGQVQVLYSTPDGQGLVSGLLYASDGSSETQRQMEALQSQGVDLNAVLSADTGPAFVPGQSPGEVLIGELEDATWFPVGNEAANPIYILVDPRCQFCHRYWTELERDWLAQGDIGFRLVPVANLGPESERMAGRLLELDNPSLAWRRLVAGDASPVAGSPEAQSVTQIRDNTALGRRWRMDGTPFTIYRAADGKVKIVAGIPEPVSSVIADWRGASVAPAAN